MLDMQTGEHGYREVAPPYLVREEVLFRHRPAAQVRPTTISSPPTGAGSSPTAEVPLTNMVRETVLDEADLPLRMAAHTPRASAPRRAPPARTRAA